MRRMTEHMSAPEGLGKGPGSNGGGGEVSGLNRDPSMKKVGKVSVYSAPPVSLVPTESAPSQPTIMRWWLLGPNTQVRLA